MASNRTAASLSLPFIKTLTLLTLADRTVSPNGQQLLFDPTPYSTNRLTNTSFKSNVIMH
ncbi:hypothetical protein HanIR_Chr06g0292581 [Helianthus annuus]|nr:hypothetical protein HanIR_Chr06g0292581 [Helianthus annuus]